MRIRFRYSLTTLLLLPLVVGIGIKWHRGPHEYSSEEQLTPATLRESKGPDPFARCLLTHPRAASYRAYRNLDGSVTRHGPEISIGFRGEKMETEFRGGQRHGVFRYWNSEGILVCEGQFENDEPAGEWVYYRYGIAYQRVKFHLDGQSEIQSRYDLDRLAERRVKAHGTNEVWLTAWHWHNNDQKRLEGGLLKDLPVGQWYWWDEEGREILSVTFQDGVPVEFVGRPKLAQFMTAEINIAFENWSLKSAVGQLTALGFPLWIECDREDLEQARCLGITTASEFRGGLAFYLALRKAGLTLDIHTEADGAETLVIVPANEG